MGKGICWAPGCDKALRPRDCLGLCRNHYYLWRKYGTTVFGIRSAKTHCPKGHPYSAENTRIRRGGGRVCRTCERVRALARYYALKRAAG